MPIHNLKASMKERFTITQVNGMSESEFMRVFGGVFEKSPEFAHRASQRRPFQDFNALHRAVCEVVRAATPDERLTLICRHPDLVGRAALAGTLTPESTREQASAGLGQLSAEEIALFQRNNAAYREKFKFPFIICARLNKKDAILAGFKERLNNSAEQEVEAAIREIFKIAELRLRDIVADQL